MSTGNDEHNPPFPEAVQTALEALKPHPEASRLILTGFMGCGKTTLGRKLAQALGHHFIDTDARIEALEKRKTADIFREKGEAYFRRVERDVLTEALQQENIVISTGGGALVQQANLDLAIDEGIVIYIALAADELLDRIIFSPKERPLVDVPDPQAIVQSLLAQRLNFYEQAQVHVEATGLSQHETLAAVIQGLYNYVFHFLPGLRA